LRDQETWGKMNCDGSWGIMNGAGALPGARQPPGCQHTHAGSPYGLALLVAGKLRSTCSRLGAGERLQNAPERRPTASCQRSCWGPGSKKRRERGRSPMAVNPSCGRGAASAIPPARLPTPSQPDHPSHRRQQGQHNGGDMHTNLQMGVLPCLAPTDLLDGRSSISLSMTSTCAFGGGVPCCLIASTLAFAYSELPWCLIKTHTLSPALTSLSSSLSESGDGGAFLLRDVGGDL
jgi:hypothetical protein